MKAPVRSIQGIALAQLATMLPAAAAITLSTNAPTAPAGGIVVASNYTGSGAVANNVNLAFVASDYVGNDQIGNYMIGQSFTTGTLGTNNKLDTISVKSTAGTPANYGGSLTIRLWQITGYSATSTGNQALSNQALLGTWTADTNGTKAAVPSGTATWFTFDLSQAITLADNTIYAFTLGPGGTSANVNSGVFFHWDGTSTNAYVGNQAVGQGLSDVNTITNTGNLWFGTGDAATGDRVFQVTAVPEPAAALLGGLGVLMFFRRRR